MGGHYRFRWSGAVLLPDTGIWHPMAPRVFETHAEYDAWYDGEHAQLAGVDAANAPTIGIVLQKSHINTGDECHYVSLIAELELRGAKVVSIYSGGLDFSGPVTKNVRLGSTERTPHPGLVTLISVRNET